MATGLQKLCKFQRYIRNTAQLRDGAEGVCRRLYSAVSPRTVTYNGYQLLASLVLERKPVISCDFTPLEAEFSDVLAKIEAENSLLSDHEVQHRDDLGRKKRFAESKATESDLETATIQTAQDFEDATTEKLLKFQAASRTTAADERNDQKSLSRALQKNLTLLVKCKPVGYLGAFGDWLLPCAQHHMGETLKQVKNEAESMTAERALQESCGTDLQVTVFGNAPIGFYKCKYPKRYQKDGVLGAKVFFFRGHYDKGQVVPDTSEDHCWATRDEVDVMLQGNPPYLKAVKSFVFDDRFMFKPLVHVAQESKLKVHN